MKYKEIKIILLFKLFVIQFVNTTAQSPYNILHTNLLKIQKESNLPGFAITIIKSDTVLFSKGYGFANIEKKQPYTIETIQPVGSVSKTFIALALMKSIELGYFTLETDINDVLPFQITNPKFPNEIIKIKHLATHTSSLIDNETIYMNKVYQLGNKPTIELNDFLKNYYNKGGKYYSLNNFDSSIVGTTYNYSNIASALMAYIIEFKSKMKFTEFTKKYIFKPLKMNNTDWFYNQKLVGNYATLYQVNNAESTLEKKLLNKNKSLKTYTLITYPDGSLKTSVNDLTLYLRAMIKGYFTNDTLIIGKQSYKTLFAKQFTMETMPINMDAKELNRGIFWAYSTKGDIRHSGSDPGILALISFNPITKIGRIITLNASIEGGDNAKTLGYFKRIITSLDNFEKSIN